MKGYRTVQGRQGGVGISLTGGLEAKAVEIVSAASSRAIFFSMLFFSLGLAGHMS
jgi:hypothetical protein